MISTAFIWTIAEYGQSPLEVSRDCGDIIWCEWIKWNADHVTKMMAGIRTLVNESGKELTLSAAVFPDYESAKIEIAQSWETWVEQGLLDIICPMLYTNNASLFRKYVRKIIKTAKGKCLVYPGIACASSHNINTPEGVEEEVKIVREEGADGVVLFSGYSLIQEFIVRLKSGVFKQK